MNKEKLLEFIKTHGISIAQNFLDAEQPDKQTTVQEQQVIEPDVIDEEAEYEDGDAFVSNLQRDLATSGTKITPEQMLHFVTGLTKQIGRVYKFCEVQETKRVNINAQRDVLIKNIEARKEIVMKFLDKSFDERKENFAKLFSLVDKAMASNNNEQLALALQSINLLAAESPFKALRSIETTKQALEDKNHEWDF